MDKKINNIFSKYTSSPVFFIVIFLVLCLLAASIYLILGKAPNYVRYEFFSEYKLTHGNYPIGGTGADYPVNLKHRDYTPLNARIYLFIFSSFESVQKYIFIIYQSAMIAFGLFISSKLIKKNILSDDFTTLCVLFFLLNPLTYRVLGGDDKAAYFLMPLICIYAYQYSNALTASLMGIFAGWAGIGAAAVPLLLGLPNTPPRRRIILLLAASSIFVLLLFSDGLDGLDAINNRAERELETPFWFSIWRWLPSSVWPIARYPVIGLFILAVLFLFAKRKISFPVALVVSICTYLLFSNNTVPTRIMFFTPLLMVCFDNHAARLRYIVFAYFSIIITYAFIKLPGEYSELLIKILGVGLCNAIMVIPILYVFVNAVRESHYERAPGRE